MTLSNIRTAVFVLAACLVGACASRGQTHANHQAPAGSPVMDTGTLVNAPYRVDIPANWNGKLVMLLHGYEPKGVPRETPWPQNEGTPVFLADGYAVAQSAYASQGWAVTDAISDNERLRAYFWSKYGKPQQTYLAGFSLGGYVALASLEQHGTDYSGALSLCGANVPATRIFDDTLTSLVAFDYFFPHTAGLPSGGISDPTANAMGQMAVIQAVEAALKGNEASADILAKHSDVPRAGLSGLISLHYLLLEELHTRAGGMPVDNRARVYSGFGDDTAFNKGVRRYVGDGNAMRYLSGAADLTGKISKPLVLQYNNNDPTVSKRYDLAYPALVTAAGGNIKPLVLPSIGEGHCDFSPEQIRAAFRALTGWSNGGLRPTSS
jgi:pimeloyl-ACP methyl ester carboxylesterase